MKKTLTYLIIFLVSIVSITSISSAPKYGTAGCGLGSVIIKEAGFAQVVAATTNGIYANQTFGITTGSLGVQQMEL